METGKLGLVSAPVHISSVAAPTEKRMDVQAPLTAVYIHTVPALPVQPYQPQLPATARETPTIHLAMPPMYSKETLPFLTLHIAGGLQSPPGLGLTAAPPASKPKSAGKHVCPHCGRDCMKPSVLEKHLRCHTGERPYPCTTCGVSFKTQSNLYKHKRTQAHARLSSESEQSSLGSLDSVSSSRETHTSSLSLDECSEELGSMDATLPAAEITCQPNTSKVNSTKSQGSVSEQNELTSTGHKTEVNESAKVTKEEEIMKVDNEKPALTVSRHLRRQEATLSSKNWENSVSTDSGFSESSDHYPSPGSVLPDHSMDSLTESNKEHLEESSAGTHKPSDPGHSAQETKDTVREQEQRKLEERISKIISDNTAVVEDKQLENVRPRKTVLSKQGSIDLPMPYTYKDSFHFDMRISKTQNVGLQRNRKPGLYSSVPTQQSTTMEHAPLTRSNSLPFSVTLMQPEKRSPTPSYQSDYVTLIRRGSSGQINPTGFTIKPVNQQSSTHRPLVRQTAVDCNHATDSLFMNSSVEESYDGDGGDICGEPSNRKFRRKKAQKFAYNKWYMYGGGTFKKLYNAEKSVDNSVNKGRKCVTTEHEVVQGSQKRLSVVYKETVTSTTTITSSSATVCHPGCPPANLPLVSAVDLNLRSSQPHSSCSPLKPPLRRNLSLSVLPLPSIGSLVSIKTNSLSSTEALTKHTDSLTSQFCGAHVPSDRKKQRTDEIEMETDPNTLTHPPPTSAPQQDTNLTNINLQQHQKHNHLKGTLIFPCISNANAPSVSTLPATSVPSAANASFLPKYQLKLPSAAESVSNVSPQVVDKPTGTTDCTLTSALSTEKTSSSATTSERTSSDPVTAPSMQTCDKTYDITKMNTFNSTQAKVVSACTATSVCRAQTSRLSENATCSPTMVHSQFAATTITTSSLHDYHAGLCSTVIQPSKSAASPAVLHLPRTVAPVVANLPVITTARNPSSATALTVFSEGLLNSDHPLSQPQSASDHLNPANKTNASTNVTNTPCHVVPFEQLQPAAQNVFHVQTADLQICFQIISDEQLALIEPQIEGQAGTGLSQRQDTEAPEVVQSKTPNSVNMERSNKHEQFESLPVLNKESIKPPQSVHFVKPQTNVYMTEHSNSTQAECKPPEAPGLMLHPHKYSHVNMATESLSCVADVMSTAASLRCVQSGNVQTSEEQQTPSWNHCAEEQLSVDGGVSQGGALSQTLSSQHKLNLTCVSPNAVDQSSTRSELLDNECQQKLQNEGALCDAGIMKANNDVAVYKSIRLESGETHPSLQLSLSEASGACANELSESVSINKCKTLGQSTQHACNPSEPTLSETQHSSKHANKGCDRVGPLNSRVPLQEITSSESHNVISSAHSEKQLHQFISASLNVQVERTKDATVVLNAPSAGLIEAEQRESQTWAHGSNLEQSNSIDCGPKTSPEAEEKNQQRMCGHGGGGGTMRNDKNEGIKTDQESTSRYTVLPDVTNSEGENRDMKENPTTTSWLSEKHLQAQSGMSESPPQSPQRAPSTSNLNLPDSSQTNFFHSPQPPLEMNNFYFSQQQWEKSYGHNQQTQVLCESNSSQFIKTQAQDQKQDQKQTQGNTTVGNNSPAVSCCTEPTTGSQKSQSFNSHHCQLSHSLQDNTAAGWSANTQASNSVMLDESPGPPLKPFTYPETEHDTKDQPPDDFTTQSSNSGRPDITNKYPSFFLSGQLHGYQPAECLTAGVRPVQSCQDYPEDTSSSDDEGKLIIEL